LFIKASSPVSARASSPAKALVRVFLQCGCDFGEGMALGKGVAFIAVMPSATAKLLVLELRLRLLLSAPAWPRQQPPATARSASRTYPPNDTRR